MNLVFLLSIDEQKFMSEMDVFGTFPKGLILMVVLDHLIRVF